MTTISSPKHIIVSTGYGSTSAYACTLDNAKAILAMHLDNLSSDVSALVAIKQATVKTHQVVSSALVAGALSEIAQLEVGAPSPGLRRLLHGAGPSIKSGLADERPQAVVTQALKDELVLWAYKSELDPRALKSTGAYTFNEVKPHASLSCMSGVLDRAKGLEILYAESDDIDAAEDLVVLNADRWKPDAKPERVVARFLSFVTAYLVSSRHGTYDVVEIADTV